VAPILIGLLVSDLFTQAKLIENIFYVLSCIATIKLSLCHSLVRSVILFFFIYYSIQTHPCLLPDSFKTRSKGFPRVPIVVLFFFYNSLGQLTNTKISGSNGMIISRGSFIFVIVGLSVLWYYVSILLSQRLVGLNALISQAGLRSLINLFFSVLSILLILSNLGGRV